MKKIVLYILAITGLVIVLFIVFGSLLGRTGSTMYGSAGMGGEIQSIPGVTPTAEYAKLQEQQIPSIIKAGTGASDQNAAMTSASTAQPSIDTRNQVAKKRMIIRNAMLFLQTNEINATLQQIGQLADSSGGYIVSSKFFQGNQQVGVYSTAEISIRVPSEGLSNILTRLKSLKVNVLREETSGEDITERYIDLQSKLKNLQSSRDQLTKIMGAAKKISEILSIQNQLTETQGKIDVLEGAIKYFNESTAFSLITIQLEMPPVIKTYKEEHWQIVKVAKQSFKDLGIQLERLTYGLIEFVIYFIPLIFFWGIIFLILIWIGKKLYRKISE